MRKHLGQNASAYFVLFLGLVLTVVAYLYVARSTRAADQRRFDRAVEEAASALQSRMEASISTLLATRGLFQSSNHVTRKEFRRFVESLELSLRYPGLQGIGFAERVEVEQLEAHEERLRAEGFPRYQVWPRDARPELFPITLLEPFDWRNRRAFGFDMYSDPTRREAMERARRTGLPVMTGRVELVQEYGERRQSGFLLYVPLYRDGEPETVEGGPAELVGFVYSPFRAGDLVASLLREPPNRTVTFELYDGPTARADALLYDDDGRMDGPLGKGEGLSGGVVRMAIAGREWTLTFRPGLQFEESAPRNVPHFTAAGGLLMSLLLFAIARSQVRARGEAERSLRRSAVLAEAGTALSSSLELGHTLAAVAELCARELSDVAWLELVQDAQGLERVASARGPNVPPGAGEAWGRLLAPPYPAAEGPGRVLASGEPWRWAPHEEVTEPWAALRGAGVRSVLAVPLRAHGATLGVMVLLSGAGRRPHRPEEEALALDLARLVGAAVENARLYRKVQEAVRLRDEFLSIASHELRTPLTSLQLQVQSLQRELGAGVQLVPAERVARVLDTTHRQSTRLAKLIANLLDISRIVSGRMELELEELELGAVCREVAARLQGELRQSGGSLRFELEEPLHGLWDRLRLEQVLTNLLSNAFKYGAGKPVLLRTFRRNGRAFIQVQDQGIGIAQESQARIFERFERAVPSRNYGGLGLGLYIVRQIVQTLGGEVRVESVPGEGSVFTVELPLIVERHAPGRPASAPPADPTRLH